MKTEIRNNGIVDVTVIVADEGKKFILKDTNDDYGNEVWLGFIHYKNGQLLEEPYMLTPDDFDEVDDIPEEEDVPEVEEPNE